eukprot:GEMP01006126.1.p1 GENE.GEMP01006126.1~~GEMP01006126.1.p1  ORF type:complete len:741 (+),score=199.05 GEMP01006126.1:670-2892(+)
MAFALLDSMHLHNLTPDVISFNTCIHAVDSAAWTHALTLLDRMRDCAIAADSITHVAVISACTRGGAWGRALELLDNLVLRNERTAPCFSGKSEEHSAKRAREAHTIRIACNATIAALGKAGEWQRALRIVHTMPCGADVISYNTCISAFGAAGLWHQALALFGDMPVMPDVISCNAVISACTKEWRQALRVYSRMREGLPARQGATDVVPRGAPWHGGGAGRGERDKDSRWRTRDDTNADTNEGSSTRRGHFIPIRPTVVTYGALITACERGGAWLQAMTLLRDMECVRVHGNTITYNAAISACEKRREWTHALALFDRMQGARIIPDVITYSALISACRNGNAWQKALTLFATLDSAPSPGAEECTDSLRSARLTPNLIAYNAALSACDTGAQWQQALRLLARMTADTDPVRGADTPRGTPTAPRHDPRHPRRHREHVRADVVSFSSAIAACEKAGKWQHALGVLRRMRALDVAPNAITYNVVLSALSVSGARHCAGRMVEQVVEQMKGDGVTPNAVTYSIVLKHKGAASRYIEEARQATILWAAYAPAFVTKPYDAIMLLQILGDGAPDAFLRKVREWVFDRSVKALRDGDLESLRQFDLPNLGPLTREALDSLGLFGFDARDAQKKTQMNGASRKCDTVKAREILAHVRTSRVDRVVSNGLHSASKVLPSVYIDHDRSAHAERQALLQIHLVGTEGIVELYITHRPCISCIAAMVTFQKRTPRAILKVAFDELDCD